jgi:hypothetical protein
MQALLAIRPCNLDPVHIDLMTCFGCSVNPPDSLQLRSGVRDCVAGGPSIAYGESK